MTHEFRTTHSKLDCALPTLHPKHSNTRGAIIRVRVRVKVRVGVTITIAIVNAITVTIVNTIAITIGRGL